MQVSLLLLLLAACAAAHDVSDPLSTSDPSAADATERLERCAALGFDVEALDCRLCSDLSTFLTTSTSAKRASKTRVVDRVCQECQECCSDFSTVLEAQGRRYRNVVLAWSPGRWRRYPKVAHFVEHEAAAIQRLEVREMETRLPVLQFFDDVSNEQPLEEIRWGYTSLLTFGGALLTPGGRF